MIETGTKKMKINIQKMGRSAILALLLVQLAGCSAYLAAKNPGKKNFEVLKVGTVRAKVIAEFGRPIFTEKTNGTVKDIFKFVQGYNGLVRTGASVGNAVASIATLGLWEVIGTPATGYFSGSELSIEVSYDQNDRVLHVEPLKGEREVDRNLRWSGAASRPTALKPANGPVSNQNF
jgi:hypothetical protein